MRRSSGEDATVWIGYADFITTLAVLFLVLIVGVAARLGVPRAGTLTGAVVDDERHAGVDGCTVLLGERQRQRTTTDGSFRFTIDSLRSKLTVGLLVQCPGFRDATKLVSVAPSEVGHDTVSVTRSIEVSVRTLPGDALFEPEEYTLKATAVSTVARLGRELKATLGTDAIAVQGHTDDVPFAPGRGKDNWMLSGERAAAAAKVLSDSAGISPCQLVIMGFGDSRPVSHVEPGDSRDERKAKRARNRRIEFRQLKGETLGGECAQ